MIAKATGRHVMRDGQDLIVLQRTFVAPLANVWAAVTYSPRLGRWIGTWTGDPATGFVQFQMNAEGQDAPEQTYEIRACQPPHLLRVHIGDEAGSWDLGFELTPENGGTTLEFFQVIDDLSFLESVGPGWEYYLDRLVLAETGGDPSAINFERDYYPALSSYYSNLVPL